MIFKKASYDPFKGFVLFTVKDSKNTYVNLKKILISKGSCDVIYSFDKAEFICISKYQIDQLF